MPSPANHHHRLLKQLQYSGWQLVGLGQNSGRSLLQSLLPTGKVLTHEDVGLDSDNKEALVFALLAHETWHHRPGNLPTLTGAKYPVVLGQITPGSNYLDLITKTWCFSASENPEE